MVMAKKFEFSLQTLLRIRQQEEKIAIAELGKAQAKKNRILERQNNLQLSLEQKYNQRQNLADARQNWESARDIASLQEMIRLEQKRIAPLLTEIEGEIKEKTQLLMEKSTQRRVVEKLKENAYEMYLIEQRREENKENDDMNQNIYQWRKKTFSQSL